MLWKGSNTLLHRPLYLLTSTKTPLSHLLSFALILYRDF